MSTFEEGEIKEAFPNDVAYNKSDWADTFIWQCNEQFIHKISKAKHSQVFALVFVHIICIQMYNK